MSKKMKPEQIAAKAAKTVAARHKSAAPRVASQPGERKPVTPQVPAIPGVTPLGLPALPKLPRAPRKPKPVRPCECGCGGSTKSRFVPGHDGRLHGWVLRVERGVIKLADIQPEGVQIAVAAALRAKGGK